MRSFLLRSSEGGTQPIIHRTGPKAGVSMETSTEKRRAQFPAHSGNVRTAAPRARLDFFPQRLRGPGLGVPPPGSSSASARPARRRFVRGRPAGFPGHRGARRRPAACGEEGAAARPQSPPDPRAPAPPASPARRGPPGLNLLPAAAARRPRVPGRGAEARARRPGLLWRAERPAGPRAPGAGRPRAPGRPGPAARAAATKPRAAAPSRAAAASYRSVGAAEGGSAAPRSPHLPEPRSHCAAHLGPGAAEGDCLRQQQKNAFSYTGGCGSHPQELAQAS